MRRGEVNPLLVMLFPFQHNKEGIYPSSSHFHSNSDTMRRRLAPPCCIVPFRHGEEGIYFPPHRVIFSFQFGCDEDGHAHSLLCPHSNFDAMMGGEGGMPPYYVFLLIYFRYTLDTLDYFK